MKRRKIYFEDMLNMSKGDKFFDQKTDTISYEIAKVEDDRVWTWGKVDGRMIEIYGAMCLTFWVGVDE